MSDKPDPLAAVLREIFGDEFADEIERTEADPNVIPFLCAGPEGFFCQIGHRKPGRR
jgi:hypothetical protein